MRRSLLLTFLVLSFALPASAREWRITVDFSSASVADPGYLAISDSGWLMSADIGAQVGVGAGFLVGLRTRFGGNTGSNNQTYGVLTDLTVSDVLATVRWHYPVLSWMRPFIEGEVGASRAALKIHSSAEADVRWGVAAGGQLGIEFRAPPGLWFDNNFSFGLELSGGYHWRQPFEFDDIGGADLGTLDLHGALWRVGVSVMW